MKNKVMKKNFDGHAVSYDADWFCQCDCFLHRQMKMQSRPKQQSRS